MQVEFVCGGKKYLKKHQFARGLLRKDEGF